MRTCGWCYPRHTEGGGDERDPDDPTKHLPKRYAASLQEDPSGDIAEHWPKRPGSGQEVLKQLCHKGRDPSGIAMRAIVSPQTVLL
jgi:hypothetical protein